MLDIHVCILRTLIQEFLYEPHGKNIMSLQLFKNIMCDLRPLYDKFIKIEKPNYV